MFRYDHFISQNFSVMRYMQVWNRGCIFDQNLCRICIISCQSVATSGVQRGGQRPQAPSARGASKEWNYKDWNAV